MKRFIRALNTATVRVILFVSFHILIGPVALLRRLFTLFRRPAASSFWKPAHPIPTDKAYFSSPL